MAYTTADARQQLLDGLRLYALREFGLMARVVFRMWGITRTDDFGEIVFNLIDAELMSKTTEDTRRPEIHSRAPYARCTSFGVGVKERNK